MLGQRQYLVVSLADLPAAGALDKTDVVHASEMGLLLGGALGLLGGILLLLFPPQEFVLRASVILLTALGGAMFGAWTAGMAGAALPNSRLRSFEDAIERGEVLWMVGVPWSRIGAIETMLQERRPEARFCGVEPHMPAFP